MLPCFPILSPVFLLLLSAAATTPPAVEDGIWSRGGSFSFLTVYANFSMQLLINPGQGNASLSFFAAAPVPAPLSFAPINGGSGPWGSFQGLSLLDGSGAPIYTISYHPSPDAFTFSRTPTVANSSFPWFAAADPPTAAAGVIYYRESYMLPGGRFPTLSSCAAAAASSSPPSCANLTGEWCCAPVAVTQRGASLTSTAAWGTGNGTISGLAIDMTFSNVGKQSGAMSPDCSTIHWTPAGSTWARAPPPATPLTGRCSLPLAAAARSPLPLLSPPSTTSPCRRHPAAMPPPLASPQAPPRHRRRAWGRLPPSSLPAAA